MAPLTIHLDDDCLPPRPGRRLAGHVTLEQGSAGEDVELALQLVLSVDKERALIPLEVLTLAAGEPLRRFALTLPQERRSFAGRLFQLRLQLRARIGEERARVPLELAADPDERLKVGPRVPIRGDYRGVNKRLFALAAGPLGLAGLCALGGAAGLGALYLVAVLIGGLGLGLGAGAWRRYQSLVDAPELFVVTVEEEREGTYRSAARGERLHCQLHYEAAKELREAKAALEIHEEIQALGRSDSIFESEKKKRPPAERSLVSRHEVPLEGSPQDVEGRLEVPAGALLPGGQALPSLSLHHARGRFEARIAWTLVLEATLRDGGSWRHEVPLVAYSPGRAAG